MTLFCPYFFLPPPREGRRRAVEQSLSTPSCRKGASRDTVRSDRMLIEIQSTDAQIPDIGCHQIQGCRKSHLKFNCSIFPATSNPVVSDKPWDLYYHEIW